MASVRYVLRKLLRFSKDFVRAKAKLTPEQYEALLALKAFSNNEGLTVGQLSERVQVKHHTAVSLTDKLTARKLVTKRRGGGFLSRFDTSQLRITRGALILLFAQAGLSIIWLLSDEDARFKIMELFAPNSSQVIGPVCGARKR